MLQKNYYICPKIKIKKNECKRTSHLDKIP